MQSGNNDRDKLMTGGRRDACPDDPARVMVQPSWRVCAKEGAVRGSTWVVMTDIEDAGIGLEVHESLRGMLDKIFEKEDDRQKAWHLFNKDCQIQEVERLWLDSRGADSADMIIILCLEMVVALDAEGPHACQEIEGVYDRMPVDELREVLKRQQGRLMAAKANKPLRGGADEIKHMRKMRHIQGEIYRLQIMLQQRRIETQQRIIDKLRVELEKHSAEDLRGSQADVITEDMARVSIQQTAEEQEVQP